MAAIKGSKVALKKSDGGTFAPIAGARGVSFELGGDDIDVTTADDIAAGVSWRTFISGIVDFSASINGVLKDADAFSDLVNARLNGTADEYELEIEGYGKFAGNMIITSMSGSGQYDDAATYEISVRAAEPLTWTKASA